MTNQDENNRDYWRVYSEDMALGAAVAERDAEDLEHSAKYLGGLRARMKAAAPISKARGRV